MVQNSRHHVGKVIKAVQVPIYHQSEFYKNF